MSYLIFDIETIPDLKVWTPPQTKEEIPRLKKERQKKPTKSEVDFMNLVTETWRKGTPVHTKDLEEAHKFAALMPETHTKTAELLQQEIDVRKLDETEEEEKPFPPLFAHQPVAIGGIILDDNFGFVSAFCAGTSNTPSEADLLRGFGQFAPAHTLVTFNGKGFDMPVILLRSFKHGISHGWHGKDHRYKYDERAHVDLALLLTNYERKKDFSLDAFAALCGLPGKDGVEGSMVEQMYDEGKHAEIEAYCLSDCYQTAAVFLRFLLLRSRIGIERYQEAATKLLAAWNSWNPEQAAKINTTAFLLQE